MTSKIALGAIAGALLVFLSLTSVASADVGICSAGSGSGQCHNPQGLATDFETGHLYVADQGNNRIDVFDEDGTFINAFGWGVDTGASELQSCTTASGCNAGIAGSGAGQFSSPTWIAVDNNPSSPSRHDVYVGTDNFHVQKFSPAGELLATFGKQGKGECELNREKDPVAVGPEGVVYVADSGLIGTTQEEGFFSRIERFSPAGVCLGQKTLFEGVLNIRNLAVDSNGNSYVTVEGADGGVIRKYDSSGALLYELDKGTEANALAVDASDDLFAQQDGGRQQNGGRYRFFTEYGPGGATLERVGYLTTGVSFGGIATAGPFYFSESGETSRVNSFAFPPLGPFIVPQPCQVKEGFLGNTRATLLAEVNPEGKSTTAHFQYVDQKSFETEGGFASPKTKTTPESESIGADFVLHEASVQAEVAPETEYHCRVIATNADGSTTGEEGTFKSREPLEIGLTSVSGVQTEAATLNATVNPLGIPTTGFFEYVEEATYLKDIAELGAGHGFDHATKAPDTGAGEEAIEFGVGESFKAGSAQVSGLEPGTSYRFRVIATDSFFPAGFAGPTKAFRTFATGTGALPDNRAWELVSPGLKNSAEVAVPGQSAGLFEEARSIRIQAGATSGEAITYTSWTSFGLAGGAPATSQYFSKRTPSGWKTENISPFGFQTNPLSPPYNGFSPDLKFGAFKTTEPPLTPDCRKNEDLYLRDNETGELHCLDPEVAEGPESQCLVYAGASEDGSRVFLAGKPSGGEAFTYSLYEWTAADGPQLTSVLPNGEPAPPTGSTSFGPSGNTAGRVGRLENCQFSHTALRHAISADGRVAFWTYVPENESTPTELFVRVNGAETLQLDAPQGGSEKVGGNGVFRAASADGSVAYFTDPDRLVKGSKAEAKKPDLYRYELGKAEPLTDLTKGAVPGDVQGVVGASDDGSYVYFVAKAALVGASPLSEEENEAGETAREGADNLYLDHEGKTSFIATLAPEDSGDWSAADPRLLSARVSPDGRHLAFLSTQAEALAGYDNTIAKGEHCQYELSIESNARLVESPLCPQAFLYDAAETGPGKLTCASCNPSGARPLGPTVIPGWTNGFEGPRFLSDNGQRYFFESFDALSPADENGKLDVYEYERAGEGGCSSESPSFDPVSGGCHFLISNGKSTDESFLVDASADGRDVFFSTRSALTGWDVNENFDVYDARAPHQPGEVVAFPEPSQQPSCLGEACKPPPIAPPVTSSPPHFEGPGNSAQKPRKPGKPRRPRHAHKHGAKKKHARANHKRRAGR